MSTSSSSSSHRSSAIYASHVILTEVLDNIFKPKDTSIPRVPTGWVDLWQVLPDFDIDKDLFEMMEFRENLLVSSFESGGAVPTPVGGMCLDIQSARGLSPNHYHRLTRLDLKTKKFLVHVTTQFDYDRTKAGSAITSWVDVNLRTLEERRREFLGPVQSTLYTIASGSSYYLRANRKKDIYYTKTKAHNLISEGGSFLLMRYMAIQKIVGTYETVTTYLNGDLCRNIYVCKGPSGGIVNGTKLDVCKIRRIIIEECGIEHHSSTLLTLQGQILRHEWRDCAFILQVNPLAKLYNKKPTGHVKIPLEKAYQDDVILLAQYLDAKTRNKKVIENYLHDHKEISDVLSDLVKEILQLKPDDCLEYSARYFLNLVPELLPHSEYRDVEDYYDEDEDARFYV